MFPAAPSFAQLAGFLTPKDAQLKHAIGVGGSKGIRHHSGIQTTVPPRQGSESLVPTATPSACRHAAHCQQYLLSNCALLASGIKQLNITTIANNVLLAGSWVLCKASDGSQHGQLVVL